MGDEKLNDLMIVAVEKEEANNINLQTLKTSFHTLKPVDIR